MTSSEIVNNSTNFNDILYQLSSNFSRDFQKHIVQFFRSTFLLSHFGLNTFPQCHLFHLTVHVFVVDKSGNKILLTPVGLTCA